MQRCYVCTYKVQTVLLREPITSIQISKIQGLSASTYLRACVCRESYTKEQIGTPYAYTIRVKTLVEVDYRWDTEPSSFAFHHVSIQHFEPNGRSKMLPDIAQSHCYQFYIHTPGLWDWACQCMFGEVGCLVVQKVSLQRIWDRTCDPKLGNTRTWIVLAQFCSCTSAHKNIPGKAVLANEDR